MPDYSVRWEICIPAESPLEAACKALTIQRDPVSTATVFDVQIILLDAPDNWDRIDLTPNNPNPWQLYSSHAGWQDCAARLDQRLAGELALLDIQIAGGESLRLLVREMQERMVRFMDMPQNGYFGAGDTEPRFYLWQQVERYFRATHLVSASGWVS